MFSKRHLRGVRHPLFGLALVGATLLGGCATPLHRDPEGDAAYTRTGSGTPVVLQAGLGDDKTVWRALTPLLTPTYTVLAFDRPGHGGNPATDAPRDPCTVADEQHRLLHALKVPPPYILVGHSLGGLYDYVYAKRYPEEVAALILLDPTHPKHWETLQREVPAGAGLIKLMRLTVFSRTDRREFDAQADCLDQIKMDQPLTMPVRLLVSARFKPEERETFVPMIQKLRQDWLPLLGLSSLSTVWDSGHYIQKDSPEEIAAAIDEVAAQRRSH